MCVVMDFESLERTPKHDASAEILCHVGEKRSLMRSCGTEDPISIHLSITLGTGIVRSNRGSRSSASQLCPQHIRVSSFCAIPIPRTEPPFKINTDHTQAPMPLYLGLDVGTSGTKALLYDPDKKQVLGRGSIAYGVQSSRAGEAEQDPAIWIEVRFN